VKLQFAIPGGSQIGSLNGWVYMKSLVPEEEGWLEKLYLCITKGCILLHWVVRDCD
jgi:hypothetical protein